MKVVADANGLTDEDFETLMDDGFSKEEICEIIAVIDLATMFNVYTSSPCAWTSTRNTAPYSDPGSCGNPS
jgi:hypothetical protein